MNHERYSFKAPQDVLFDVPQENLTGDVLKGRGPRRGNLERLLRYWRPIMRKPGGFRRCRVILADHPELYPLNNICAWLHHETTGLWPNEGCHHPTMKNCRRKLKNVVNGSIWSNEQFNNRLSRIPKGGGKSLQGDMFFDADWYTKGLTPYDGEENYVVTPEDMTHAFKVLSDFCAMEPQFADYLRNNDNWEFEGENEAGFTLKSLIPPDDCGCD